MPTMPVSTATATAARPLPALVVAAITTTQIPFQTPSTTAARKNARSSSDSDCLSGTRGLCYSLAMGRYPGIATITVKRSMAKVGNPTQPVRVEHTVYPATMLIKAFDFVLVGKKAIEILCIGAPLRGKNMGFEVTAASPRSRPIRGRVYALIFDCWSSFGSICTAVH